LALRRSRIPHQPRDPRGVQPG